MGANSGIVWDFLLASGAERGEFSAAIVASLSIFGQEGCTFRTIELSALRANAVIFMKR